MRKSSLTKVNLTCYQGHDLDICGPRHDFIDWSINWKNAETLNASSFTANHKSFMWKCALLIGSKSEFVQSIVSLPQKDIVKHAILQSCFKKLYYQKKGMHVLPSLTKSNVKIASSISRIRKYPTHVTCRHPLCSKTNRIKNIYPVANSFPKMLPWSIRRLKLYFIIIIGEGRVVASFCLLTLKKMAK